MPYKAVNGVYKRLKQQPMNKNRIENNEKLNECDRKHANS